MAVSALKEIPPTNSSDILSTLISSLNSFNPTTATTKAGSPEANASLDALMQSLTGTATGDDFSKEAAGVDSDALVAQIMQAFKEQALPQIYQAQTNSGGYNSTTGQLLANDAFARSVAQGQAAKVKTATDYANVRANAANAATNAAGQSARLNQTTTQQTAANPLTKALQIAQVAKVAAPYVLPNKAKSIIAGQKTPGVGPFNAKQSAGDIEQNLTTEDVEAGSAFGGNTDSGGFGSGSPNVGADAGTFINDEAGAVNFSPLSDNTLGESSDAFSNLFTSSLGTDIGGDIASNVGEDAVSTSLGDIGGQIAGDTGADIGEDAVGAIGKSSIFDTADEFGSALDIGSGAADVGSGIVDLGADFGGDAFLDVAGSAGADIAGDALTSGLSLGFPYFAAADAVGKLFGINEINDVTSGISNAIGGIVEGVGDGIGDVFSGIGDALGSVICSELYRQGKITQKQRMANFRLFRKHLSGTTITGYKCWARPITKKMRTSEFWTKFGATLLNSWIAEMKGSGNFIGKFLHYIVRPITFCLGVTIEMANFITSSSIANVSTTTTGDSNG